MSAKNFFKGASVLATSQIFIAACTFIRNIIVARLISVENYGIATVFALVVSLIEMSGNMSFDRILVQDKDGDSDDMLASAHVMLWTKSALTALIFLLAAEPIASLFNFPDLAWAFRLLALIPLIKGFTHYDSVVQQRDMKFTPTACIDTLPQLIVVLAAYPIASWLGDYRVMLVIIITQTFISMVLSHILARRPYRWKLRKDLIAKKLNFGWPLLINGFLMFAIFQGDKAVIGANYSMEVLGWYGAAFSLTLLPTLLFAKVSGFLLLPLLSKSTEDPEQFLSFGILSTVFCTAVAIFFSTFFTIGGAAFIHLSYGEKYIAGSTVIAFLGLMQAMRILRIAPTVMATAQADTKNSMYANIVRTIALLLAIAFAYYELSVEWIAISGLIGEVLALFAALYLLKLPSYKTKYIENMIVMIVASVIISTAVYFVVPMPEQLNLQSTLLRLFAAVAVSGIFALSIAFINKEARVFMHLYYRRLFNRVSK